MTSPESLTTLPNNQFSFNCTARAEVDGQSIPVDIKWTRIDILSQSGPSDLSPTLYTTTGSPERGYQSFLTTSENDTVNTIIYHCTATTLGYSIFNDTTILVEGNQVARILHMLTLCAEVFSSQGGVFTTSSIPTLSYEVACLPQNTNLNRFRNIYPCENQHITTFPTNLPPLYQIMIRECL